MATPEDFRKSLAFTLQWEGGYVDHPLDPGGPTNYGITQATYDRWRKARGLPARPVRQIERSEVEAIYLQLYWLSAGCNQQEWPVNCVLFDSAVNCGVARAKKWLEQTANWGRDSDKPIDIARDLIDLRVNYHIQLATHWTTAWRFRPFLRGWLNRCRALKRYIGY